jgi:arsenite methyltransferase
MSMTQESSRYFKNVADQWDTIRTGYFGEAVRETAISKAYLRPEMVVADVGAGTGFVSAGLAPLVRRVYVVDGSAAMLDMARKNLSAFNNVEFHEADGLNLPFPDESLDAVFSNMVLHHMVDPLAAIREMVRVLRPGGRLVITDMDAHEYAWFKEEMADVWQGFQRDQIWAWYKEADLVNIVVDCTGESCCAETAACDETSACGVDVSLAGELARVSVFVAAGTRRMKMREAVESSYAARAADQPDSGKDVADLIQMAGSQDACCSTTSSAGKISCCTTSSTTQSSCCSADDTGDSMRFIANYSTEELGFAPKEAADFSLGCGNPIAMSGLQPGEVVLDIGSGGGLDSFIAAGKVGPSGKVIGVDMTPEMLARARDAAARNQITNVEFRHGFAEALPIADGEVDVILSNCVINLTEDKGQVFQEAFRALKPGGRLEVSDIVTSGPVPIELRESAAGWAGCVTGALPEKEYLDLVAQAGFTGINTRRSDSVGSAFGVSAYSVIVSARKPGE